MGTTSPRCQSSTSQRRSVVTTSAPPADQETHRRHGSEPDARAMDVLTMQNAAGPWWSITVVAHGELPRAKETASEGVVPGAAAPQSPLPPSPRWVVRARPGWSVDDLRDVVASEALRRRDDLSEPDADLSAHDRPALECRLFWSGNELPGGSYGSLVDWGLRDGVRLQAVLAGRRNGSSSPASPSTVGRTACQSRSNVDQPVAVGVHVHELYPEACLETGGAVVQVRGTGFDHAGGASAIAGAGSRAVCRFGHTSVPATVRSPNMLICTAPPHAPGAVTVEVSLNGHSFTADGVLFTYFEATTAELAEAVRVGNSQLTCTTLRNTADTARLFMRNHRDDV